MTRKGKLPIDIPKDVDVKIDGEMVVIKGPKGQLEQELKSGIKVSIDDQKVVLSVEKSNDDIRKFQGLYRTLLQNNIDGVTKGFEKHLEMIGVGYRANVQGANLNLSVGFSHPTLIPIPTGISVAVEKNTKVVISGIDKQQVGQFAAQIRSIRPPEPYQGKGIRYAGEHVRRKAGKAAAKK